MRRIEGFALNAYLPSLGLEGAHAVLQEVWQLFLDGTIQPYTGVRMSAAGNVMLALSVLAWA